MALPFVPAAGSPAQLPSLDWTSRSINNNPSVVPLKDPLHPGLRSPWPHEYTQTPTHVCGIIVDATGPTAKILLMRFPPAEDFSSEALESPQERSFPMVSYGNQDAGANLQHVAAARMWQITGYYARPYTVAYHPDPTSPTDPGNKDPPSHVEAPGPYFQINYATDADADDETCSYFIMTANESDQPLVPPARLPHGVAPFWMDLGAYGLELDRKCRERVSYHGWMYSTPFTVLWWAVEHLMTNGMLRKDMLGDYAELHADYRAGYSGRDDRGE